MNFPITVPRDFGINTLFKLAYVDIHIHVNMHSHSSQYSNSLAWLVSTGEEI